MPTAERDTPLDIQPYDHVPLSARTVLTGPDFSHPDFRAACEDPSDADFAFLGDNTDRRPFMDALYRLTPSPRHQVGGHALSAQDAAEPGAARVRLGTDATWEAVEEEAPGWTLPAQVDSDQEADMTWGDVGTLYRLIRPEDLADLDFEASAFTWQCT